MTISVDSFGLRPPVYAGTNPSSVDIPAGDVRIVTSGGLSIPAHSSVLASVSRVLENLIDRPRKHRSSEKIVAILGVPCDAVVSFLRFLYYSSCTEDEVDKFGIHLLTLSHVYSVPELKQKCTRGLAGRLTAENVIDVLQLARLCDAPDLYLKCLKMVAKDFKIVEATEGWKFLQDHDPWLELEILKFQDEIDQREKRKSKTREEQKLYVELCEAMECLEHICTEGCTSVGPYDKEPTKNKGPCSKFSTCQGLQRLIRHFATCKQRVNGRCNRCIRMWQLLRLHSSICRDQSEQCRVPLCRQFKLKPKQDGKGKSDDLRWKLLVRKVACAKVMSSLSFPKMKKAAGTRVGNLDAGLGGFQLPR